LTDENFHIDAFYIKYELIPKLQATAFCAAVLNIRVTDSVNMLTLKVKTIGANSIILTH